jgi:hypothetical protein
MGWQERPIFGKIRYMNLASTVRGARGSASAAERSPYARPQSEQLKKFDTKKYIAMYPMKPVAATRAAVRPGAPA